MNRNATRLAAAGVAALALVGLSATAHADVAAVPSGGCDGGSSYDGTCTVAEREQPGTTCVRCPASESEPCETQFDGTGFDYVCTGDVTGDSWIEVWCDGEPAYALVADGAGACSGTLSGAGGFGLLAVFGLLLAARRRRRMR